MNRASQPFVILSYPRTGSTWLAFLLDSHPDVLCHTEVFNPISTFLERKPDIQLGSKEIRDKNPVEFLRKLYATNSGQRCIGFKLMPGHNARVFSKVLLSRAVKKVVLTRRRWLDMYLSILMATGSGVYQLRDSDGRPEQQKVELSALRFRIWLIRARAFYAFIRVLQFVTFQRFCWIDYEELGDRLQQRRLLVFLDVEPDVSLTTDIIKVNTANARDRIGNFEEFSRHFSDDDLRRWTSDQQ